MKNKKLLVSIVAVVFAFVVICLAIAVFTIKQVKVSFSTTSNSLDAVKITADLQEYKGSNLLFFKTDVIKNKLEENPYVKVTGIEKKFPNVIEVSVEERREVYFLNYNEKTFVLDKDGFVLAEKNADKQYNPREYINLKLSSNLQGVDFSVKELAFGKQVKTADDELFYQALSLCEQANLTDNVKELKIEKFVDGSSNYNLVFLTHSNVQITVLKAQEDGVAKTNMAFTAYDNEKLDYNKSNGYIFAYKKDSGEISIIWTDQYSPDIKA